MRFTVLCLLVVVAALFASCAHHHGEGCHGDLNTGVLIHVSSGPEQPHRALMALQMATLMAETQDVCVYCDIKAVRLVLAGAPDVEYRTFPSSKTLLGKLIEKGVPVLACPGCLKAAGKSGDELMKGVKVADKKTLLGFTSGRVVTLDY